MKTNKQNLIESINKQRKLMGLDEIMDVNANIDAKGALSGNKLDLGVVPLEEMEPEDDDEPISFDDERSDDERDFYRGEDPMSLGDKMDMQYPDPNERNWHMNRYSGKDTNMEESGVPPKITPDQMMNEAELDELFGTGIGAGIANAFKGVGQNFKTGRVTQQIKNSEAKFAKVIAQANAYLTKNEKIFNELMAHQKTLASLSANDPIKKSLETILTNSKATWDTLKKTLAGATQQINQFNQATAGTAGTTGTAGASGATVSQTNQPTGSGQNLAQSGQTAPNFKPGDKVTYTDPKTNTQKFGTIAAGSAAAGNSMVLYQGSKKPVPVLNANLQPR